MLRKPVVLITGASGEIGHGLIERLAQIGDRAIITLDLQPARRRTSPGWCSTSTRARSST